MAKAKVTAVKRKSAKADKAGAAAAIEDKCAGGVCAPYSREGLKANPASGSNYDLVRQEGPGVFLGGRVTKQGGDSDITYVTLEIDGQAVMSMSFSGAATFGLTQHNPFGVTLLRSTSGQTLAFGFPTPLMFRRGLRLNVNIQEANVVQIIGTAVCGKI